MSRVTISAVRFLDRIRRAWRPAPAGSVRYESPYASPNHLASFVRPDWMPAGEMTRDAAMAVPAVARARRVICHAVAASPLGYYRGEDKLDDKPAWIDRTDGPTSPYHRMTWLADDLLFHGWSCWAVARDDAGRVIAADRVPYEDWSLDEAGRVVYRDPDAGEVVAAADSVVLIPGPDEGILARPAAIRHAADLMRSAAKVVENPVAYIDLHQTNDYPMTGAERDELVSRWAAARRGENGGVAYSSNGIEVKALGSPAEHLLIDGRNAAALDIARTCGIPGVILDATAPASMTYVNAQAKLDDLVTFGLAAYMTAISARLSLDDVCPRGTRVAFELEGSLGAGHTIGAPDDGGASTRPAVPDPAAGAASPSPAPAAGTTTKEASK